MTALDTATIVDLKSRYPRAFSPAPGSRALRFVLIATGFGVILYLCWALGLLSPSLLSGLGKLADFLGRMWPPAFHDQESAQAIPWGIVETVAMAFAGTVCASVISVPLGFLGARTVVGNPLLHFLIRRVFDFFRGVPALIWALVFTRAVGLGPMTGVLAFIAADFAAFSKLNAEAIENADQRAIDGVRATGAARLQVLRFGLLPQVLPVMLSQMLFGFESNVRAAAILGIVGAGGIGRILDQSMHLFYWREVAMIILLFLVTVAVIDTGSRWLRQRLIGRNS